jgi:hypothetical protein
VVKVVGGLIRGEGCAASVWCEGKWSIMAASSVWFEGRELDVHLTAW